MARKRQTFDGRTRRWIQAGAVSADPLGSSEPGASVAGSQTTAAASEPAPPPPAVQNRKAAETGQPKPEPDRSGDPRYFKLGLEWIRIGRDDITQQRQEREAAERRR